MSTDPQSIATRHFHRNYAMGMINGAVFGFVDSVISPYLVLTVFVNALGAPNLLVASLPAIANGGWFFPQFFISHRLQQLPHKLGVYRGAAVVRVITWTILIVSTLILGGSNPTELLVVFFVLYTIYCFAAGFSGIPFMDIVAKTIPIRQRGTYFGQRDLWGAVAGIAAGFVVSYFLNPQIALAFPFNFGALFFMTGIMITVGMTAFSLVIEPPEVTPGGRITFRDQLYAARHLLHENNNYRRFLLTRIVLIIADIATPFYAIYATQTLNIPTDLIGVYIGASTLAGLIANPIWSRISNQRGNRIVAMGAATTLLTLPLIAILFGFFPNMPGLGLLFGIVFVLMGIARPAANIAFPSYLLEIAPANERSLYIGFTNTILGIATFIPIVGGWIVDQFGFHPLFGLTFGILLLGWWLARGMIEPRNVKKQIA